MQNNSFTLLLGDQAVALGSLHAGISAAYAYPGTPSTEILEALQFLSRGKISPKAVWSSNEKAAYEEALGVSFAGRRALVAMKHVGLNVAADPFVNSALVDIGGGLVLAVADDPGMHSSQNEQDSRYLADFAKILCLEPSDSQECYSMAREAFDLSERFGIPVMLRLVTRLAHGQSAVKTAEPRAENAIHKVQNRNAWILIPQNARRQWKKLLDKQSSLLAYSENCEHNTLFFPPSWDGETAVITAGLGRHYYAENAGDWGYEPALLHIGAYPLPVQKLRALASRAKKIYVFEDGYPYIERWLAGILPGGPPVLGKLSGHLPLDGELTPDTVRAALSLTAHQALSLDDFKVPGRPPQLCHGCPHADSFHSLNLALKGMDQTMVTSDIGCYSLGALPPYSSIETCVCMGASIGLAKGAADAGFRPALAVIGDGTFLHSGLGPLMDAAAANTPMTVLIFDNETIAMTGGQPTVMPVTRLSSLILGLGVDPKHLHVLETHPRKAEENAGILREEILYEGLSVIVLVRECLELVRHRRKGQGEAES